MHDPRPLKKPALCVVLIFATKYILTCIAFACKNSAALTANIFNSLDLILFYCRLIFPGGHVENGEGIVESTVREVKEETGLDIEQLKFCGLINWYNNKTHERWFLFLYKTETFSGEMLEKTHEGKVYWLDYERLFDVELARDMDKYLNLFLNDNISEAYAEWNDDMVTEYTYF